MAQEQRTSVKSPLTDDFAKFAKEAMEHFHVPGAAVSVVLHDEVFSAGYGMSVLPDKPVTPQTRFYCGSTTKSFVTATLELLMQENKDISWNTPISSIIRDDWVLKDEYMTNHITLEDAACHRTSIPRHEECYGDGDKETRDIVRRLRHMPLMEAPFRTKFEYSNIPWMALSIVIEKLSGTSLEENFRSKIWKPLGMDNTSFGHSRMDEEAANGADIAQPYYWYEKEQKYLPETRMDLSVITGAGANVSTVLDYAKYLQMMLKRASPLPKSTHEELHKPRAFTGDADQPDVFVGSEAYTLGWFMRVYRGIEIFEHAGGTIGFTAQMAYIPKLSLGVMILGNASEECFFALEAMFFRIVDVVLGLRIEDYFDFVGYSREKCVKAKQAQREIRSKLYGDVPAEMRKGLPLHLYEGTYTHPGYTTYTFKKAKQNECVPDADPEKEILRAEDGFKKTWPHAIELEYVNGPFFIAWLTSPKDAGRFEKLVRGVKAQFTIQAEGIVSALGIAMEPAAGDQMIWFERVKK